MNLRLTQHSKHHSRRGMTILEVLTTSAISLLVFLAVTCFFIFSLRTMTMMGNYNGMNQMNRYAVDVMNRDIRNAHALVRFTTNQLVFTNITSPTLPPSITYTYSSSDGTLTRTAQGESMTLLSNISALTFDIYQRNPSNNFIFYPAAVAANAKLINMTWKSYKTVMGQKLNTETMTSAEVVMRN